MQWQKVKGGIVPEHDRLLSPSEAAELCGVHPRTITRWVKSGKLPCVTGLGGHRRYRLGTIEKLLQERKQTA